MLECLWRVSELRRVGGRVRSFSILVFKATTTFPTNGPYYRTHNTFGQSGFIAGVGMGGLCRVGGSVSATFLMDCAGSARLSRVISWPRRLGTTLPNNGSRSLGVKKKRSPVRTQKIFSHFHSRNVKHDAADISFKATATSEPSLIAL